MCCNACNRHSRTANGARCQSPVSRFINVIGSDVPHRPDSIYGLSKAFSEDLARYYYDKFGIETVVIRIGSCFEAPRDRRMLATWMSYGDFIELVEPNAAGRK